MCAPRLASLSMRTTYLNLLRDRDLRCFFAAWGASSIGSGAGYVALLFAVQQRFGAGWAVGAVLLAQFAPAMLFGVALGKQVDRRSRRRCALVGDLFGAGAFVALAFAGPLWLVFALGARARAPCAWPGACRTSASSCRRRRSPSPASP